MAYQSQASMNLTPGTTLANGKYLIEHVLSQSGWGITLKAIQMSANRAVILKTLAQELQEKTYFSVIKQRFHEQIGQFSRCHHPGLTGLIETFEEENLPFAVLDYTMGQSLAELVQSTGPLSEDCATRYIIQVGSALTALHKQGLTHRNITPKSIIHLVGSDVVVLTNVTLMDAAILGVTDGTEKPPAGDYAAIEQFQLQLPLTPATDVYSLAGTLYFLVTGHPPIAASLRSQISLLPPSHFYPQISPAMEAALLSGLELHHQSRPRTVSAWLSLFVESEIDFPIPQDPIQKGNADLTNGPSLLATPASLAQTMPANGKLNHGKKSDPSLAPGVKGKKGVDPTMIEPAISSQSTGSLWKLVSPSKRFSKVLFSTCAIAACLGLGLGVILRIAAQSTGPGSTFFHSEQSFPLNRDWPGTPSPVLRSPAEIPEASSSSETTSQRPRTAPRTEEPEEAAQPEETVRRPKRQPRPIQPAPSEPPATPEVAPPPPPQPENSPAPPPAASIAPEPSPVAPTPENPLPASDPAPAPATSPAIPSSQKESGTL
jgi:serine/threonine-protein kinase